MKTNFFYSYIIKNKFNIHYKGFTSFHPTERLKYHNNQLVQSTAKHGPWELIFFAAFPEKKLALDFEKYLKSGSGIGFARKHFTK
jgi:putative endonuclease